MNTNRLLIEPLEIGHSDFVWKLLNSEKWLQFIGQKNVVTIADAKNYIQKILDNKETSYFVVSLKGPNIPIGLITFIKREYLPFHDVGFAFLEKYFGQGFAFEATKAVINELLKTYSQPVIMATTLPSNLSSIKLLNKLGFYFEEEICPEGKKLLSYSLKVENFSFV